MSKTSDIISGPTTSIEGVEIFNTYPNAHDIEFSENDIDQIIKNFNEHTEIRPNVKISHSESQAILKALLKSEDVDDYEELPALGFLANLRKKGQSIIADIVEIPEKLKYVYKKYKTFSPEILWNYRGRFGLLLSAVSLTNMESMKHMPSVFYSEMNTEAGESGEALRFSGDIKIITGEKTMAENIEKDIKALADEVSGMKGLLAKFSDFFKKKKDEDGAMSTEQIREIVEAENAKHFSEIANLKKLLNEKSEEQKKFSETVAQIKAQTMKEKAELICKNAIAEGVPPAVVNHFRPILFSEIGNGVIKFAETTDAEGKAVEVMKSIAEIISAFFEAYPDKVDMGTKTRTEPTAPGDPDKEKATFSKIEKRAEEIMKTGVSEFEAVQRATKEIYGGKK